METGTETEREKGLPGEGLLFQKPHGNKYWKPKVENDPQERQRRIRQCSNASENRVNALLKWRAEHTREKGYRMAKGDKARQMNMLTDIAKWLTEGYSRRTTEEMFVEKYNVAPSTYRSYERKAFEQIAKDSEEHYRELRNVISERYEDIYKRCIAAGDYKTAVTALKELGSIRGVDQPTQIEITTNCTFDFS